MERRVPVIRKKKKQHSQLEKLIIEDLTPKKGGIRRPYERPFLVRVSDQLAVRGIPAFFNKIAISRALRKKGFFPQGIEIAIKHSREYLAKPQSIASAVGPLSKMLSRGRAVFLKITEATNGSIVPIHRSQGVYRLEWNGRTLAITAEEPETHKDLIKAIPKKVIAGSQGNTIMLKTNRSLNGLKKALAMLIANGKAIKAGRYIAEFEVKQPLLNGRRWILRTVNAPIQGKRKTIATFTWCTERGRKLTYESHSETMATEVLLRKLYRNIYPRAPPRKIERLVAETKREFEGQSNLISKITDAHLKADGQKYLPHLPEKQLIAKLFFVDFSGELNPKTGRIEPVLIEAHPQASYYRLREIDKEAFIKVKIAEENALLQHSALEEWRKKAGL